ncbi:MAG: hypothetical protein ACAF48_00545 [Candidatus Carsonella ruddii]
MNILLLIINIKIMKKIIFLILILFLNYLKKFLYFVINYFNKKNKLVLLKN